MEKLLELLEKYIGCMDRGDVAMVIIALIILILFYRSVGRSLVKKLEKKLDATQWEKNCIEFRRVCQSHLIDKIDAMDKKFTEKTNGIEKKIDLILDHILNGKI